MFQRFWSVKRRVWKSEIDLDDFSYSVEFVLVILNLILTRIEHYSYLYKYSGLKQVYTQV